MMMKGNGALSQGKAEFNDMRAIGDLDKAISLDKNNAYLYYNRGNVYASRKDYSKAIADYTRAIEIDPRLAEAYYNRGLVYAADKKADLGVKDLSRAGELGLVDAYGAMKKYTGKGAK